MLKRQGTCIPWALILLLLSPISLSAQIITGEITGTVTDQSGASVAGATVSAVCPDTKLTRTVTSGTAGEYRLSEMPACVYKVSVSAQGFKTTVRNVTATVAQITKADFQLPVGARTDIVEVEAVAPLLDTSPGVNNAVDAQRIVELPFNGRDFKSILALTPGVQRTPGGGFLDVSISGMRSTSNNYLVDGMYNNDRFYGSEIIGQPGILGLSASLLPNDAIAEFTVQQLPTAEYGVKGGASINVTLKSGTNDFHGDAFYFGHTDYTDARNPITKTVTRLHNHQYGAQIGGPIVKDRTFFFANFEGQRNKSLATYPVGVPTQGDLALAEAYFNQAKPPCSPAVIPPATPPPGYLDVNCFADANHLGINAAGQNLINFYPIDPSSTPGGATQNVSLPNTGDLSQFLIKIDHKMNDKMNVSGRYIFADSLQSAPSAGFTIPPPTSAGKADMFNTVAPTRVQMVGLTWTYSLAANKILDTRFNWQRYSQILDVNNKINPLSLGVDTGPLDPLDYGVPVIYSSATAGYIGGVFGYPLSTRPTQVYDSSAHFTWIRGTHTMKMGGNFQHGSTFSLRNRARSRFFSFETDWVTSLTEMLLGRMEQTDRSFGDTSRHIYQPSMGVYWQDEWKFRPRLTLSFGLRWELNGALGEADKRGSNFSPTLGLVKLGPMFPRLYDLDFHDFGPRAGLSWDIFGNGKTALRIGYSMTYDVANFAAISAPYSFNGARAGAFTNSDLGVFSVSAVGSATPCTNGNESICTAPAGSTPSGPGGLFEAFGPDTCYNPATNTSAGPDWICFGQQVGSSNPAIPFQTFGSNPTGTPRFNIYGTVSPLLTPRIQYYSLTLQHEVFRNSVITVSYVGSKGQNLFLERSLNNRHIGCWDANNGGQQKGPAGTASNTTTFDCSRPFDNAGPAFQTNVGGTLVPSFKYIMQLTNAGHSDYNALQASFRQRDWHNINTQYTFTWSNCIDNNSTNRGGGSTVPVLENPTYVPDSNRGPCDTDIRRNFSLGGTYTVPKWSALGRAGEGWELGSVFTAITGAPWTPIVSRSHDHSGQDNIVARADCLQKPQYDFSNPNLFITNAATAFAYPADGTVGTCGRNSLRVPGLAEWDANLIKTTRVTERLKVQFRWEVFNVLNRANFSPFPAGNSWSPSPGICNGCNGFAGLSTTPDALNPSVAQGSPRVMQFGLKILF